MENIYSYYCISLRKASYNISKVYDTVLSKVKLKITQFSSLRNFQKLGKTNISSLSYLLELDRTNVYRNLKKFIEMDLISNKYENNNKNNVVSLKNVGKNKLREATIVWEETQYKYDKTLGIKNYEKFETLIPKITKINV